MVREEPAVHRRPEPRSTASGHSNSRSTPTGRRASQTPFDLFAGAYREQHQRRGGALGLNPLVAAYGPALLDRAILDAVGKATGQSFAAMITSNVPGIARNDLTPDLKDAELQPFLPD